MSCPGEKTAHVRALSSTEKFLQHKWYEWDVHHEFGEEAQVISCRTSFLGLHSNSTDQSLQDFKTRDCNDHTSIFWNITVAVLLGMDWGEHELIRKYCLAAYYDNLYKGDGNLDSDGGIITWRKLKDSNFFTYMIFTKDITNGLRARNNIKFDSDTQNFVVHFHLLKTM